MAASEVRALYIGLLALSQLCLSCESNCNCDRLPSEDEKQASTNSNTQSVLNTSQYLYTAN